MILDERGFKTFTEWCERAKDLLRVFGNPPDSHGDKSWQDWGASLGLLPTFPIFPSPYRYEDWREWVQALNRVVNPLPTTAWNLIPNFAENGAFSVNVLTYYLLSTVSLTVTLNGSLPTGWTFVSPNLAHSGAVLAGPNSISFTASYPGGLSYTSNTFTVQGI